jgi:hypothetical protein
MFRVSDFGLLSDFGFRISDLCHVYRDGSPFEVEDGGYAEGAYPPVGEAACRCSWAASGAWGSDPGTQNTPWLALK